MYRDPALSAAEACPACGGRLEPLQSSLPAAGCVACGGLLLGPEAGVHVMRGLGDALESELAEAGATRARRSTIPPPRDTGARACPRCGQLMMRVVIGQVIVDSCAAHGTWFDRDELGAVVKACRKLKKSQPSGQDGQDVSVAGVAEGAGVVVAGMASLAWDAISSAIEAIARGTSSRDDTSW